MQTTELWRFLLENCPVGISHHRESGEFLSATPACGALLGRPQEALLRTSLFDLAHPAHAARVRTEWAAALRSGAQATLRMPLAAPAPAPEPSGAPVPEAACWIELTLCRIEPGDGRIPASLGTEPLVVCTTRDVTAQAARETAIAARLAEAESAERHRDHLVQMTPGMIWYGPVSPDLSRYHITYLNQYLFGVTGYTPKQWIETPGFWRSIIHPDDLDAALEASVRTMKQGGTTPAYRLRAADGRYLWLRSTMAIERDAAGVPVRMYGLTLDVTVYKQAEFERAEALAAMSRLKQRLDTLIATIPGVVWESGHADSTATENYCSDYVERLSGYTKDEWVSGRDGWLRFVPDEERADVDAALAHIAPNGSGSLLHRLHAKDGRELWLENHIVVLRDETGQTLGLRGIALDVTDRRRAELEHARLQDALAEQAQRLLEVSTPLIPVTEDVLVMPLVGTLDPGRAQYALETLLSRIASSRARQVIIDVTGVGEVDAQSSMALVRAVRAAKLLGARCLLTGVRAEIATALVSLGVNLGELETRASLRSVLTEILVKKAAPASAPERATARLLAPGPSRPRLSGK